MACPHDSPISGRKPGERGQLQRIVGYPETCEEVQLSAYTNVIPPQQEMPFPSIGSNDRWVREHDQDSVKGSIVDVGDTTGRVGDDGSDRQLRSILDSDTTNLPDDTMLTGATLRIRRADVTRDQLAGLVGRPLQGPQRGEPAPAREHVEWHLQQVFREPARV